MRSQNNKVKNSSGSASSKSGKLGKNADVDSRLLKQLSSKMGNQGLSNHLQQSSAERDLLLQFIGAQLKGIQNIQQIELDEVSQRPEWFREVAKGENGYALPDPERWKEAASLYKQAGQALCQGNVSRGKQLLEQALEKEDATRESMPKQVAERVEGNERSMAGSPVSTATEGGEICPACNETKELTIADKIMSVRSTVKKAPPIRRTRPFNWWEELEESQEEEVEQEEHQTEQIQETEDKEQTDHEHNKDQNPQEHIKDDPQ